MTASCRVVSHSFFPIPLFLSLARFLVIPNHISLSSCQAPPFPPDDSLFSLFCVIVGLRYYCPQAAPYPNQLRCARLFSKFIRHHPQVLPSPRVPSGKTDKFESLRPLVAIMYEPRFSFILRPTILESCDIAL